MKEKNAIARLSFIELHWYI